MRGLALVVLAALAALALGVGDGSVVMATQPSIQLARFGSATAFAGGTFDRSVADDQRVVLAAGEVSGSWMSPSITPGFTFTRLVASWNADTPAAGRLRVEARATTAGGEQSDWYSLGVWAADDYVVTRTSIEGQADALGKVSTDTLTTRGTPFVSYVLRASLDRASSDDPSPTLRLLAATASGFTYSGGAPTSSPTSPAPVELSVPALSQEIHARQYPQWGGGGEAWCSPTSTEMVVEYWGRGPTSDDLAWVDPAYTDPSVDYAARSTYDAAYRGTGNWPFNTAYAGRFGLEAFVTQLHSLAEAEQFVRAGIPLVASLASRPGELDGFLFAGGTNGHLVVIVGFDSSGRPIVNDPAAWSDSSVRRPYDRAQFERVWLRGSGGTVYVIHPPEVALPQWLTEQIAAW